MEQDTSYALQVKYLKDISFQKIRNIAKDFVSKLPKEVSDELYEQLERGCDLITTEPQLQQYIYSFGYMHEAKLNLAFDNVPKEIFDYEDIAVIDYGCGQAMATMVLADYIRKNNYNIENIKSITLIEPSQKALDRAELHASCFYPPTTQIKPVNKFMDDLTKEDLYQEHSLVIHLFSNILDVESFSLEQLADTIKESKYQSELFICIGPYFGEFSERQERFDYFSELLGYKTIFSQYYSKGEWQNNWTCSAKILANIIEEEKIKTIGDLLRLANKGDGESFYKIAKCFEDGDIVEKDEKEAFYWYRKAAEQGLARAQFNLGYCYYNGQGVEQDYNKAVEWYRKAAEQGYAIAQCNLGNCYYNGQGIEQDYNKAVEWYRKAAEQGLARAQCNLGYCYDHGQGVEQDYNKAVEWYRKAAEQGDASAQNNLGVCYKNGQGVTKDYKQAVEWYKKAAEQGNASAQNNLGVCYKNGQGVTKDYKQAVEWYKKAAEQGNASAQYNLGVCYDNGQGVEQDYKKAVEWHRKDIEQGNTSAQYTLEKCYNPKKDINLHNNTEQQSNKNIGQYLNNYVGIWEVISKTPLSDADINNIKEVIVTDGEFGKSFCFLLKNGFQQYITCSKNCNVGVGESIKPQNIEILTLKRGQEKTLRAQLKEA